MSALSELLAKKTCSTCRWRMAAPMEHWDTWHCVAPQNIRGTGYNPVTALPYPEYTLCKDAKAGSGIKGVIGDTVYVDERCKSGAWWVQSYYVGGNQEAFPATPASIVKRARGLASTKLEDI